tara:strand:+ start:772 stop:897 length:126 start_codon:yes stop_codon:yes gene_type:complete
LNSQDKNLKKSLLKDLFAVFFKVKKGEKGLIHINLGGWIIK